MNRGTGIMLGTVLAFASGLALAACSQDGGEEARTAPAEETTQASLPVVTVYKSPT